MGVFSGYAPVFGDAGFPTFPVDPVTKKPLVRNWQHASLSATKAWIKAFPDCNGLGICMGAMTGLVEVDIDEPGDGPLAEALRIFGDTPVTIRTASGKSKAWYRHNGELRRIRPFKALSVDLLGSGYTICPPSFHSGLNATYEFLTGGVEDLRRLPPIRRESVDDVVNPSTPVRGHRNTALFRFLMREARYCDDLTTLIDVGESWCADMPDPITVAEIKKTARSVWGYESRGRNYLGQRKPVRDVNDTVMDALADEPAAYFLWKLFERYHGHDAEFRIAPTSMAGAGNPPWSRATIERKRDILLDRKCLVQINAPSRVERRAGTYRLSAPNFSDNN